MNIAGVLVNSHPDHVDSVKRSLAAIHGVEVHAATPEGRIIVIVDEDNLDTLADTFRRFHDLSGVLSAALVYHHFESDPAQES